MIVPIHTTTARGPTDLERIDEAARKFSTNEHDRECFRKGALFWKGDEEGSWGGFIFAIGLLTFLWIFSGIFVGAMDAGSNGKKECKLSGKWGYVNPAYYVGCEGYNWLSQ